jgi:hypothetical protein
MIRCFFCSNAKEFIKYDCFHIHSLRYLVDVIEVSICVLCQQPFAAGDMILEQRLVADTQFCNVCFTEFMMEQGDINIFSSIR